MVIFRFKIRKVLMLSRIFVSLLILSALTSDGTVNLAEYLFSSGLYVDTGFLAVSEKEICA